jgi:probable rRNA maturation factor
MAQPARVGQPSLAVFAIFFIATKAVFVSARSPSHLNPRGLGLAPLELTLQRPARCAVGPSVLGRAQVLQVLRHALERPGQITVRLVDEAEGRQLNAQFRGRDYATNVLTFDYARQPVVMADLVLCVPVLVREARQLRRSVRAHAVHLLIHGVLHAQGWDHETSAADADRMETLESLLMLGLGLPDPYAAGQRL